MASSNISSKVSLSGLPGTSFSVSTVFSRLTAGAGGAHPLCYPEDASASAIVNGRARH